MNHHCRISYLETMQVQDNPDIKKALSPKQIIFNGAEMYYKYFRKVRLH